MKYHDLSSVVLLVCFLCGELHGAVVYGSSTYTTGFEGLAYFDLDGDSKDDIQLDISFLTMMASDSAYVIKPLGSTLIAASDGITDSFASGDLVVLANLHMIGNDASAFTGGYIATNFGAYLCDGWGGITYDVIGNPIIPAGGPIHQIDHFLVKMDHGIAWVKLESENACLGSITANWGYASPIDSSFSIIGIPEPSTVTVLSIGCLGLLIRRRKA